MSTRDAPERKKVTIQELQAKKDRGEPVTMLTAYDYAGAALVDAAGIDSILVGDSLAMVVLGLESTVSVTMEEMLHHCRAVARGAQYAFLVGDMPFMSYQASAEEAVRNAGRFLKEAGMEAVKLEGGHAVTDTVRAISRVGIPVMGHIGLTPQTLSALGGYRVQGKTATAAYELVQDALALEEAGCFSIVLEAIPAPISAAISKRLTIPTIGIGAGRGCDGQVLVFHDMLGLFSRFQPRFVKQYVDAGRHIANAFETFREEVVAGLFPAEEHAYEISDQAVAEFHALLEAEEA